MTRATKKTEEHVSTAKQQPMWSASYARTCPEAASVVWTSAGNVKPSIMLLCARGAGSVSGAQHASDVKRTGTKLLT
eukprot:7198372-Karenia_brevis.AAC.1